MRDFLPFAVIATWICIVLGFLFTPQFFLVGAIFFLVAASVWTFYAVKLGYPGMSILGVWALPVLMGVFLGFAFMWLPKLPDEK